MARKPSARVVMNRAALEKVYVVMGDAAMAVAQAVVETADPPDATPYGEGLVTGGGWLAYVGAKKIGGGGLDGKQPKKPRAVQVRGKVTEIQAIGGFGFPARFQEVGTINHAAQPFLTPALDKVAPRTPQIMGEIVKGELGRLP